MILLSTRLKELRLKAGLTQQKLGDLVGITKVSVCCYEKGTRLPSLDTLVDLANTLNVDVDYLLGNDYYQVADNDIEYAISLSKEEIQFIKEIRKYGFLHNTLIEDPKRFTDLIYKKLK